MPANDVLLNVENVSLRFGGTAALANVSFDVRRGEIRAIIGPNGAGKTSMLNCISGFYRPQDGRILFRNQYDLTKTATPKIAQLGLARTFQNIALYTGLSTLDNLMAARHIHMKQNALQSMLYWGRAQREHVDCPDGMLLCDSCYVTKADCPVCGDRPRPVGEDDNPCSPQCDREEETMDEEARIRARARRGTGRLSGGRRVPTFGHDDGASVREGDFEDRPVYAPSICNECHQEIGDGCECANMEGVES